MGSNSHVAVQTDYSQATAINYDALVSHITCTVTQIDLLTYFLFCEAEINKIDKSYFN